MVLLTVQHSIQVLRRRRGVTVVEFAVVFPLVVLLILGMVTGGLGIARYQQVAHLARLGARYASVHGGQYEAETGQTAASQADVRSYLVNQSTALDSTAVTVDVYLNRSRSEDGAVYLTKSSWDSSDKAPYSLINDLGQARKNTVTVRVRYQWYPETWLAGPITLTSTSTMPMQY